jgi:hypothetical protein
MKVKTLEIFAVSKEVLSAEKIKELEALFNADQAQFSLIKQRISNIFKTRYTMNNSEYLEYIMN